MTMRSLPLGLASAFLFALSLPSLAQTLPPRLQPQPGRPQPSAAPGGAQTGSARNEKHERAKMDAQAASQKGDHEHSLTLANGVLAENPNDDVALYLRASAKVEIGRRKNDPKLLREGIADARQAISLKQRENALYYLPYLYGMSSLSATEGKDEHAQVAVKIAQQISAVQGLKDDEKANIIYQLGIAHMTLKDPKAAAEDFESTLRLVPNHVGAHMAVADAYLRANNVQKASASFDRAIAALPRSPLVYNNRGMFRHTNSDYSGAITDFTRALEIEPGFFVALTNRGYTLLTQGNVAGAEADFSASLNANPEQNAVYSFRGAARLAQGKIDAATADFKLLTQRAPKDAVPWSEYAFARYFARDYAGALKAFDQAATLDQSLRYLNPWRYQAMILSGRPENEVEQFAAKNVVELKDDDWTGGLFAYVTGRMSADDLLKRSQAKNEQATQDQTCEAHFFIAQRLAREGKGDEAAKHYQQALDTGARHLSSFRGAQFALKKFSGNDSGG